MSSTLIQKYLESTMDITKIEKTTSNFWKRVANIEGRIGKGLEDDYTKDELLTMLSLLNASRLITFRNNKFLIDTYLKWIQSSGYNVSKSLKAIKWIEYEELEMANPVKEMYFRDFDHLQRDIRETVERADSIDEGVHATDIAIIYMAWLGITKEEAVFIWKRDLMVISNKIRLRLTNREVDVPEKVMEFLLDYSDSEGYEVFRRNHVAKLRYKPGICLIRSVKNPELSTTSLAKHLSVFSSYYFESRNNLGGKFAYERVARSSLFCKAYEYEQKYGKIYINEDNEFLRKLTTQRDRSEWLREYKVWKSIFH